MNPTQSCSHVENVTVSVLLRGLDVDAVCSVCGCAGDISMCLHCCRAYCTQGQHGIAHHCHPLSVSLDDLAFRCHCCAADMPHDAAPFTGIAKTLRMQQSLRRHRLHAACSTLGTQQYISWGSPLDLPSAADFGTTSSIPDDESSSAESQPEEAPPGGSSDEASESVATTEGYESIEFLEVVLGVCQEDMGALAAQPPVAEEDCCTAERQGVTLGKLDALAAAAQPQQRGSVAECCFCGMEVALEAGAAPKMRCPGCRRVSCSRHAVEWHHGMSCAGYDSVQKWRKTAGVNRASRARKPRA